MPVILGGRRRWRWALCGVVLGAAASGCSTLTTRHPVGEPVQDEVGQQLSGIWCEAGGDCWNLRYRTAGAVELTPLAPDLPWAPRFTRAGGAGLLTAYGDQWYLHLQSGRAPDAPPEYLLLLLRPRAKGGGVLHLWEPRLLAFREAIEKGGLEGAAGHWDVKVTASKAALEAFLTSHSAADLFDLASPRTFVRQPSKVLAAWERAQGESDGFHVAFAKTALAMLGYATGPLDGEMDPLTALQLKQFQAGRSLPATGEVDAETLVELLQVWSLLLQPIATLPARSVDVDGWETGTVEARGTWQRAKERLTFKAMGPMIGSRTFSNTVQQTTTITCYQRRGICIAGTASGASRLDVVPEFWDIEAWDEHEIRATSEVAPCKFKATLQIERASQTVTERILHGNGQTPCEFVPIFSAPLVDGEEVTKQEAAERREWLLEFAKRFGTTRAPATLPRK